MTTLNMKVSPIETCSTTSVYLGIEVPLAARMVDFQNFQGVYPMYCISSTKKYFRLDPTLEAAKIEIFLFVVEGTALHWVQSSW